jgi:hypothetical protein
MSHNYLDVAEKMLREKHGLPADFKFFNYESIDEHTKLTGKIVTEHFQRGPRKGRPKWNTGGEPRVFIVSDKEVESHPEYRTWK